MVSKLLVYSVIFANPIDLHVYQSKDFGDGIGWVDMFFYLPNTEHKILTKRKLVFLFISIYLPV